MSHTVVGIAGAGGYGREVLPIVRTAAEALDSGREKIQIVFVDSTSGSDINGTSRISESEFIRMESAMKYFVPAIGDSHVRQAVCERFLATGISALSVKASNSVVMDSNVIGEGLVLSPFSTITSNTRIGRFFQANLYSYVAHDCVIGDFVTFAPAVKCNGWVEVGDHAYIGAGACIKPGSPGKPLKIGSGATIGMGAVVTKDVPAGATVVGNPARSMPPAVR